MDYVLSLPGFLLYRKGKEVKYRCNCLCSLKVPDKYCDHKVIEDYLQYFSNPESRILDKCGIVKDVKNYSYDCDIIVLDIEGNLWQEYYIEDTITPEERVQQTFPKIDCKIFKSGVVDFSPCHNKLYYIDFEGRFIKEDWYPEIDENGNLETKKEILYDAGEVTRIFRRKTRQGCLKELKYWKSGVKTKCYILLSSGEIHAIYNYKTRKVMCPDKHPYIKGVKDYQDVTMFVKRDMKNSENKYVFFDFVLDFNDNLWFKRSTDDQYKCLRSSVLSFSSDIHHIIVVTMEGKVYDIKAFYKAWSKDQIEFSSRLITLDEKCVYVSCEECSHHLVTEDNEVISFHCGADTGDLTSYIFLVENGRRTKVNTLERYKKRAL